MILDLDILIPTKKQIRIGGQEYELNAGVPTALMLAFQREIQIDSSSAEAMESVIDVLKFAFRSYDNAVEIIGNMTLGQTLAVINHLFGVETDEKNG
ncbi:MAG: hypothetical protein QME49_04880 [bacterium]|nr:hypothetical protein [bacterium]